ncbi:MAG: hypothetical protein DHS80DRAFT_23737 [Piptocephalis tieghemiana]|nr:MAG: hypothetical protein DHS80DRAFT_23737 [Piptocephalis tieghemiana]
MSQTSTPSPSSPVSKMVVDLSTGNPLLHSADDAIRLRRDYHILGNYVGPLPSHPLQPFERGLPLLLSPMEHRLLRDKELIEESSESIMPTALTSPLTDSDSFFRLAWDLGWYLGSGLKYGGDFLCYGDDPYLCHAAYVATIMTSGSCDGRSLISMGRVANAAKKRALLYFPPEEEEEKEEEERRDRDGLIVQLEWVPILPSFKRDGLSPSPFTTR